MADQNLRDDMLKLVRYNILFIKRGYEHAFLEQEELLPDNLDAAAYTTWKIAVFIQQLREQRRTTVPARWKQYPPHDPRYRDGNTLVGFPEADQKYLRVSYQVLDRWPRQAFKFEEKQISVLEQIRDKVQPTKPPPRLPRVRDQLLDALRERGVQSAEALAQQAGASIADVQTALDALEREGQVSGWDGLYGPGEQVGLLRHLGDKLLDTLAQKGDCQTRDQLAAGLSAEELSRVDQVLNALEAFGHLHRRGARYGLPAWSTHLDAVKTDILDVLRQEQRPLSAREVQGATGQPFAAVRDSLRALEADGQVQRRGSRYELSVG